MREPTVSVVIPAYRAAATIRRPLESILRQTRRPTEIIVIDDGSPDDIDSALAPFRANVKLIRKQNGGAAAARNLGIEHATGDVVAFLDADDYWEPIKLERQLEVFGRDPAVGLVSARWYEEYPGRHRVPANVAHKSNFGRRLTARGRQAFNLAMCIWTGAVVVRRELLLTERFVPGLEPAEDRDLWIRLASRTAAFLLDEPLATYVLEPNSLSRSNVDRDCGNMLRVVRRHAELLGPAATTREEAGVFARWAGNHLARGNAPAALPPAIKRLRRQPLSAEGWWVLAKSLKRVVI